MVMYGVWDVWLLYGVWDVWAVWLYGHTKAWDHACGMYGLPYSKFAVCWPV